jgi:hypothetical protein
MNIYIQTNSKQFLASKVSAYSFIRFGHNVKLMNFEESEILKKYLGKKYLRNGKLKTYENDLQSFTPLRFLAPILNNNKDLILVIDPDIFAISDPKIILDNVNDDYDLYCTSYNKILRSEMMLINAKKIQWNFEKIIKELFELKIDYKNLMSLSFDPFLKIKIIDNKFNSHDKITDDTILLHTTNRITQPWKEGLLIDFDKGNSTIFNYLKNITKKTLGMKFDRNIIQSKYQKHPDNRVLNTIKTIFLEAKKNNFITEQEIQFAIKNKFISEKIFN